MPRAAAAHPALTATAEPEDEPPLFGQKVSPAHRQRNAPFRRRARIASRWDSTDYVRRLSLASDSGPSDLTPR